MGLRGKTLKVGGIFLSILFVAGVILLYKGNQPKNKALYPVMAVK